MNESTETSWCFLTQLGTLVKKRRKEKERKIEVRGRDKKGKGRKKHLRGFIIISESDPKDT